MAATGTGERVLYQPVFSVRTTLGGEEVEIVGIPDFLIRDGDGYRIRDAKLSLHANEKTHAEILLQLGLYAYLFTQAVGRPPTAIEALLGDQTIVEIPSDNGAAALELLASIKRFADEPDRPYSPVGWSKCQACGFRDTCWPEAAKRRDVALVYGVDQGLARELHRTGVTTYDDLIKRFDEEPSLK